MRNELHQICMISTWTSHSHHQNLCPKRRADEIRRTDDHLRTPQHSRESLYATNVTWRAISEAFWERKWFSSVFCKLLLRIAAEKLGRSDQNRTGERPTNFPKRLQRALYAPFAVYSKHSCTIYHPEENDLSLLLSYLPPLFIWLNFFYFHVIPRYLR